MLVTVLCGKPESVSHTSTRKSSGAAAAASTRAPRANASSSPTSLLRWKHFVAGRTQKTNAEAQRTECGGAAPQARGRSRARSAWPANAPPDNPMLTWGFTRCGRGPAARRQTLRRTQRGWEILLQSRAAGMATASQADPRPAKQTSGFLGGLCVAAFIRFSLRLGPRAFLWVISLRSAITHLRDITPICFLMESSGGFWWNHRVDQIIKI